MVTRMYHKSIINLLVVAVLLVGILLTVREVFATVSLSRGTRVDSAAPEMLQIQRVNEASAQRLNAQAEYYLNQQVIEAERIQRVSEAETQRWNAQAEYYLNRHSPRSQRSIDAEIQRWNAMAEYYRAK